MFIIFKENLKKYREQANIKKADFARLLDLKYNTYNNYEMGTGEPKLETLVKISDILDVSVDKLLGRISTNKIEQLRDEIVDIFTYSNDKYFQIKEIDSGMITFTISNDDDKLTDVKFRTKDFIALVELVENVHAKRIKEDIYDLASKHILQTAILNIKRNIEQIKNDNLDNKDKIIKKSTLMNKLYEIDRTIQKQIEESKKKENK